MITFFNGLGGWDYLALGVIVILVFRGFIRGCSGELSGLVGMLAATAVGYFGFKSVARMVLAAKMFEESPYAGQLIAFILILVACIAIWLMIGHVLKEGLQMVVAQPFDAILGGVIGGAKAFVFIAALCTLGLLNPHEEGRAQLQKESVTVQKIAPLLKWVTSPER